MAVLLAVLRRNTFFHAVAPFDEEPAVAARRTASAPPSSRRQAEEREPAFVHEGLGWRRGDDPALLPLKALEAPGVASEEEEDGGSSQQQRGEQDEEGTRVEAPGVASSSEEDGGSSQQQRGEGDDEGQCVEAPGVASSSEEDGGSSQQQRGEEDEERRRVEAKGEPRPPHKWAGRPPRQAPVRPTRPTGGAAAAPEPAQHAGRTTVMMRNIPKQYTRARLVELLEREGFRADFDFLYLPTDFRSGTALGFAFVNLTSPETAERLFNHFNGFTAWGTPVLGGGAAGRPCSVGWSSAGQQGLAANIERYRNSTVMHPIVPDENKPAIYCRGMRMPFPSSSRRLFPPLDCHFPAAQGA